MLLLMYQDKGHFPFLFKDINYIGTLPGIDFWTDITYLEYNAIYAKYKHQLWSFRNEAIKYCKLDCMSLYAVIVKLNKLIFFEFKYVPQYGVMCTFGIQNWPFETIGNQLTAFLYQVQ